MGKLAPQNSSGVAEVASQNRRIANSKSIKENVVLDLTGLNYSSDYEIMKPFGVALAIAWNGRVALIPQCDCRNEMGQLLILL
jgi:hypothetical protein